MKSSKRFNKKYFKKLPGGLLVLLSVIAAMILLFTYIVHEVLWEKEEEVDIAVFNFIEAHVYDPTLTSIIRSVTYFASSTFLQIAYSVVILFYLFFKNYKRAIEIAVIGVGGYLINYVMKLTFDRSRPPDPLVGGLTNFSFPSGHATSGFIFYGLLVYLVWKSSFGKVFKYIISSILILFSLLIDFSRVYLRVHYATDVIAGFCVGLTWLVLSIWLLERLKKKSHAEIKNNLE